MSNGFRAPSLHQQFFTTTSTNFVAGVPVDIVTAQVNSPIARRSTCSERSHAGRYSVLSAGSSVSSHRTRTAPSGASRAWSRQNRSTQSPPALRTEALT